MKRGFFIAVMMGVGAASTLFAQPAAAPTLAALQQMQPGQWTLRSRADPGENRSVCVADARALLQVQHSGAVCNRFVIANSPQSVTVHYTCPGAGHGRTTISVETPRLVQIESQGMANNEPFMVEFEARRVGECGSKIGSLSR